MSELIQKNDNRATIRWKLLTSVSALALMVSSIGVARAEDADRPPVWIELGGQAENISGQGDVFAPAFLSAWSTSSILQEKLTPLKAQRPPLFSAGEEAKISFQPDGSDWVVSVGIRYGRSGYKRDVHHQTNKVHYTKYKSGQPAPTASGGPASIMSQEKFVDTAVYRAESHSIMDFQAGKDVGLGLFGADLSTVLSAGIRIAQFTSRASVDMRARPDMHWKYFPSAAAPTRAVLASAFHTYHATGHASRRFLGIGPSLSWNGSAPFVGNAQNGEIAFDWGVNAAVLFGRRKTEVSHHQTGRYWPKSELGLFSNSYLMVPTGGGHVSNKSVTVPNIGGFAGLSVKYPNAKFSIGYRYDAFLGAMDTGIDARKSGTLAFKGPFASVSFGLGD